MNYLQFDPSSFDKFIQTYIDAVSNEKDTFVFQGETIATKYAKYLIEYFIKKINCDEKQN